MIPSGAVKVTMFLKEAPETTIFAVAREMISSEVEKGMMFFAEARATTFLREARGMMFFVVARVTTPSFTIPETVTIP